MELKDIKMIEKKVPSSDGIHTLSGRVYLPEGEAKGLFHVVHGMTEHISRYDKFMREIAAAGYICFGYDNLGHGFTARDKDELGFIAEKNGDKLLQKDILLFGGEVRSEYSSALPYILMGHSMGSFIVRNFALEHAGFIDRLIVMGTGGPNPASGAALTLIRSQKKIFGKEHISPMIEKMMFGTYNKKFGKDDKYYWLSKLQTERDDYRADEYCGFHFTISAMEDLVKLQSDCNKKQWFEKIGSNLPIMLISGADDPVGDYGKGVKKVHDLLKKAGKKVTLKLYRDCRHELLNETCHEKVVKDILEWLG